MAAAAQRRLTALLLRRFHVVRGLVFVACASPALWLAAEAAFARLGANPLERLLHFTGQQALTMLLVTFAVTPLRRASLLVARAAHAHWGKRIADWNWLIRLRRQFGLWAFFYATLHAALYVAFDSGPRWVTIVADVVERKHIAFGIAAFALMLPLAATSNAAAMRALGRCWQRLHWLTYAVIAAGLLHVWAQVKPGRDDALPYLAAAGILLALRLVACLLGDRSGAGDAARGGRGQRKAATSGRPRSAGSPESARSGLR